MHQITYIALELACSFSWIPQVTNHVVDVFTQQGANHLISFLGLSFEFLAVTTFNCPFPLKSRVDNFFHF